MNFHVILCYFGAHAWGNWNVSGVNGGLTRRCSLCLKAGQRDERRRQQDRRIPRS